MSTSAEILHSRYDIHGVQVIVAADMREVHEAMDLRLRGFGSPRPDTDGEPIRLEFTAIGPESPALPVPAGESRPVYDTAHGSLYYQPEADLLWGELDGVDLRCRPGEGVAVLTCREFEGEQLYLATHPLATISLMELLERRELFSLHAGCVATADGSGVLLAGPSGAGKSTLALTLALGGMTFLSDDLVFLPADATSVLGFADTIGLTGRAAERVAKLGMSIASQAPDGFPKPLIRIERLLEHPPLRSCRPAVLVFPEVAEGLPSQIAPLEPQQALIRLVPDVLVTQQAATQEHLRAIAALLEQVRCYALWSGADLERAAELVCEAL